MNKVILIGNISTDIQLRYTQSNTPVATFNLAINRPKRQDGTQEADFISIVVWGKQAENINKYLKKGSKLALEGSIRTRTYDAQDGSKRYVTEVVAENVQFLNSGQQGGQENGQQSTAQVPQNEYQDMSIKTEVQQQFEYDDSSLPF